MRSFDWATGDSLMIEYHDREWGVPLHDDRRIFEFLLLEGVQAGLIHNSHPRAIAATGGNKSSSGSWILP